MTRSQNKQQQLEQAKDIVINSIGQTMDLYGTNRSVGNLYGTMVFEGSMTLDEMRHQLQMSKPSMSAGVKKLQMSKPSMSAGVKKLQEFDIVKQQFTRGSRKQHFIAEKDFFIFFRNFFTKKFQREIDINVEAVKDAQAIINPLLESSDLTEAETQEAQKIKAQLDHTHVYYEWLEQLTEAIESGEIFKYFPIPEQPSDSEN
ncbi:GbsR/MarR family transcriptional regulator [Staphylococcus aureus]|nr:GbsR/MarR family transcriptional regulator [Staphylococcus aureus]